MARRVRLIIHGSQEEMVMFESLYNTRVRLQHGATSTSRFRLPDRPPVRVGGDIDEYSEGSEVGDVQEGVAVANYYLQAEYDGEYRDGGAAEPRRSCWRSESGDHEEIHIDSVTLPDLVAHSACATPTEDNQMGSDVAANGSSTGSLQGCTGSGVIPASPCPEAPNSNTDTDLDDRVRLLRLARIITFDSAGPEG